MNKTGKKTYNVGDVLKVLALISIICGVIISFVIVKRTNGRYIYAIFFLIASVVSSILIYGFGALISTTIDNNRKLSKLINVIKTKDEFETEEKPETEEKSETEKKIKPASEIKQKKEQDIVVQHERVCKYCGNKLNGTQKFCTNCGKFAQD